MPEGLSFDELNKLYQQDHRGNMRSMPYEQYFGEMDLSQEQIDRRIKTAKRVYDFTLPAIIALYYMIQEDGWGNYDEIAEEMKKSYSSYLEELGISFTAFFMATHVEETVADIIDATLRHPDEEFYFTIDRAILIAENEANSIWNDSEFEDALTAGYTRKTWLTMQDKRVRSTHREVEGVTIPISEYFQVGEALLLYPRMSCDHPEEIANCRCTLSFS